MPDPSPPPARASAAWQKVQNHLDKLFSALDELDEVGGIGRAAAEAGWTPRTMDRAASSLLTAREAIDEQLGRVETRRRQGFRRLRHHERRCRW